MVLRKNTVADLAICPLVGNGNLDFVEAGMEIGSDFEPVGRSPTDAGRLSVYLEFGDVANFAEVEPNMLVRAKPCSGCLNRPGVGGGTGEILTPGFVLSVQEVSFDIVMLGGAPQ